MRAPKRTQFAAVAGIAAIVLAVGAIATAQRTSSEGRSMQTEVGPQTARLSAPLQSLLGDRRWISAHPLGAEDLRGKVVLVNFWTYSCINSLRTLPYLRAWAEKYGDRGLVVIGVHAPEFAFEHDSGNVGGATASLNLSYPVVLDNDFEIWRAFGNQAWPGFYFVDSSGRVRHHAFGEGGYEQSERLIQRLLSEADGRTENSEVREIAGVGAEAAPDWGNLRSPETYIGHLQAQNFASAGGIRADRPTDYRLATAPSLNHWSLSGQWTVGREFASLGGATGALTYRFHARDLHLVLAPPSDGRAVRFRVTIDGQPPGVDHGVDTDADGWGAVSEPRMYQLVRQSGAVRDRTFRIDFFESGVRAYAFTFG